MKSLLVVLLALVVTTSAADDNAGFANCDFEQGATGWGVWYSDDPKAAMTRYPYAADSTVAHGGQQSLKIVAPDENGCAFVTRGSTAMKAGARYEVGYWFRKSPELDERAFHVRFNFRPADKAKADWKMKSVELLPTRRKTEGEWQYRAGYVRVPKDASSSGSIGLYLREARGTIWIDDVQIREVKVGENVIADLWVYDPYRVELGGAPLTKFHALKERNDPILARAARYNETLVKSAFVKEDVRRCLRIGQSCPDAGKLGARMDQAEEKLARLYRAYGEAFLDLKSATKAEAFDSQANVLGVELGALGSDAQRAIADATARCRGAGQRWRPPPAPLKAGLPSISGDGRVNQIIYANRSTWDFQQLEKPLCFDPVHSTSAGSPRSDKPGHYDWSSYEKQWEQIRASGIPKKSCLLLFMTLHDGSWAPKWLLDRAKSDPEIMHVLRPEAALSKRSTGSAQINWWHPAVRDYAREIVTDMGRTFRSRDEFLFYEFQWEAYGPYVATEKGTREVGYGKYAEADFRAWLKKKYGDIAALNHRWDASYASFDDIQPPPDRHVVERRRAGPLAAEWEAWREASYEDWCRLIYRAWKKADPTKPVMADNSNLFRSFNMPNLADTCDLLAFHNSGRTFMPTLMLLNSISRHNGFKPIAQYENFWGVQEDHDRMYEELPRRHGTQKHIFRMTVWNTFLQVWWYSYTSAEYLTHYDGNYFDPAYALTTLRYRTAALPVYFQKFKRFQRALLDSRIVTPRICVLAPTASMRNNFPIGASQAEIYDLFWELYPRNHHFDLVHEEYFLDGRARLNDFDVLVLPYAPYLDERLQNAIGKWLNAKPRLLVTAGPFGVYDELGRDSGKLINATLPGRPLKLEFSDKKRWEWVDDPAKPGDALEICAGPSKVFALLKPFAQMKSTRGFVDKLIAQIEAVTNRAACDDKNVFELVLREQGEARYLCALNPDQDATAESTVRVKGVFKSVTDLDYENGFPVASRVEVGHTVFPLRLEPGEATIIRLSP
ncbi:MAG: beta-galactosidase [Verrucomicrobia bacterium]|nr:beta-galactosidase [Verrucomicrobiota bacterium]